MIARGILTAMLGGVMLYAFTMRRRSPTITLVAGGAAAAGAWFVWHPDHATLIAGWAGVGRGVDLVLYIWVVITLVILLSLHLKLRAQTELITGLARHIALQEAARKAPPPADAASSAP